MINAKAMNPEKNQRRRPVLTKDVMARIPCWSSKGWMPKPSQPDLAAMSARSGSAAHRLKSACVYPKRSR